MRLTICSDLHLDLASYKSTEQFIDSVSSSNDIVVILGDICRSEQLSTCLSMFDTQCRVPCYFVLGNHDYWDSSFKIVDNVASSFSLKSDRTRYLGNTPFIQLNDSIAIVGHGCWYDAAVGGDPKDSRIELNDWHYISDFNSRKRSIKHIVDVSRERAMLGVMHIRNGIQAAVRWGSRHIIIATHVPPAFCNVTAETYDWNLWYKCSLLDEVLTMASTSFKNVKFTIISGHVHKQSRCTPMKNVEVITMGAQYGTPVATRIEV